MSRSISWRRCARKVDSNREVEENASEEEEEEVEREEEDDNNKVQNDLTNTCN